MLRPPRPDLCTVLPGCSPQARIALCAIIQQLITDSFVHSCEPSSRGIQRSEKRGNNLNLSKCHKPAESGRAIQHISGLFPNLQLGWQDDEPRLRRQATLSIRARVEIPRRSQDRYRLAFQHTSRNRRLSSTYDFPNFRSVEANIGFRRSWNPRAHPTILTPGKDTTNPSLPSCSEISTGVHQILLWRKLGHSCIIPRNFTAKNLHRNTPAGGRMRALITGGAGFIGSH